MNEVRSSFASLSGSLLARKGGARPAMRPRSFAETSALDDLGWDDMGDVETPNSDHVPSSIAALTPAPKPTPVNGPTPVIASTPVQPTEEPAPIVQQRALADRYAIEAEAPAPAPVPVEAKPLQAPSRRGRALGTIAAGKKAAFTLRLDADRHLRLRLASAVTGQSSQVLVTSALDTFLESLPEVGALAGQIPGRAGAGH